MCSESNNPKTIFDIVTNGFCSGCGACSSYLSTRMVLNPYGEWQPDLLHIQEWSSSSEREKLAASACPFLSPELNEDVISSEIFSDRCFKDTHIGSYLTIYGGHVLERNFRQEGTSGGMGSWIGSELISRGLIDGVIHIKPLDAKGERGPFFEYGISRTQEDVRNGAKTRYHAVEMSSVIDEVRRVPGRYLFIGLPCLCKAVRRLQRLEPELASRIVFVVSLVCGHLKSVNWTLSLGWGVGIKPSNIRKIVYRVKSVDIAARAYVFRVSARYPESQVVQQDSGNVTGGKFNLGALMLPACDYCDDIVGETADLTIGDAWIPRFDIDNQGNNLLIVRNEILAELLVAAEHESRVSISAISLSEAVQSQAGGFRQRREGLSYRLERDLKAGEMVPVKRITPGSIRISILRQWIYNERSSCMRASRESFKTALEKDDYCIYKSFMKSRLKRLRLLELSSGIVRIFVNKTQRLLHRASSNCN
jgi:coenzyme F420 hydrogenase subunit beta